MRPPSPLKTIPASRDGLTSATRASFLSSGPSRQRWRGRRDATTLRDLITRNSRFVDSGATRAADPPPCTAGIRVAPSEQHLSDRSAVEAGDNRPTDHHV